MTLDMSYSSGRGRKKNRKDIPKRKKKKGMENVRNQNEHHVLIKLKVDSYHWSTAGHNKTMMVVIIIHTTNLSRMSIICHALVVGARYNLLHAL